MKPAELREIVDAMTRGLWYSRGRFVSLVPDNTSMGATLHTNHVAIFAERADCDGASALRNHAEATCDVLDAVRDMLAAADGHTDGVYRCMDALRQAFARIAAVK